MDDLIDGIEPLHPPIVGIRDLTIAGFRVELPEKLYFAGVVSLGIEREHVSHVTFIHDENMVERFQILPRDLGRTVFIQRDAVAPSRLAHALVCGAAYMPSSRTSRTNQKSILHTCFMHQASENAFGKWATTDIPETNK